MTRPVLWGYLSGGLGLLYPTLKPNMWCTISVLGDGMFAPMPKSVFRNGQKGKSNLSSAWGHTAMQMKEHHLGIVLARNVHWHNQYRRSVCASVSSTKLALGKKKGWKWLLCSL